jgi:hypothetical protein
MIMITSLPYQGAQHETIAVSYRYGNALDYRFGKLHDGCRYEETSGCRPDQLHD